MFDSYQDIFAQRGALYHAAMAFAPRAREEEFAMILAAADLQPGERLCDMPAGGGYLKSFVGVPGVSVTALENSATFYQACLDSGVSDACLAPLEATGFAAAFFDKVVSLAGLHHIENRRAVFAEVNRILRPGGVYCIADVAQGSRVANFLNGFVDTYCSLGHVGSFIDAAWSDELAAVGFNVETNTAQMHWNFQNEQAMGLFCRLLFGLDRANHTEILQGLSVNLGYSAARGTCCLAWELTLLRCVKV